MSVPDANTTIPVDATTSVPATADEPFWGEVIGDRDDVPEAARRAQCYDSFDDSDVAHIAANVLAKRFGCAMWVRRTTSGRFMVWA